ncbi:dTDP-glucose 4,6-dehydratase [hydrothermal vent metagenome]|uniref:dTDP-glucose 4,6-dehydratase n=2 Tax=hydrothermal vent metagenome TaxID=652676 RepID=A0A3B1CS32_9ZZZZ
MNHEIKNYLVTGGAGFIGSHLVDSLLSEGNNVITIDNFDEFYGKEIKLKNVSSALTFDTFQLIEGDIRNKDLMDDLFSNNHIDVVIHLAAKAGVRPSIENTVEYYDVNINGTLNILEAMKKFDVKNLIFASSSSVYGNNEKVPFSENDIVDYPISPYAATKKSGELLCHTYHHLYDFKINCLRFFTVYGPRQRPDLAIHKFSKMILNNETIPMFGDGTTKRDYTYIDDIIQGIKHAVKNLNGYEVFNLGESRTIMLKELIALIEKEVGKKANIEKLPLQPGDVEQTYADISKAKEMLGYDPQYEIEEGIKNFIEWLKNS